MIDSLVFYRECLTWAYFLGKEPFDAFEHVACVFIMTSTCGTPVVLWQVVDWNLTAMLACVAGGLQCFPFGGRGNLSSSLWKARDGAGARALASHQCGSGSNPGVDAICGNVGWVCCWFSPLLREVFLRAFRFSPLLKNQHFQIPIWPGIR